MSLELSNWLLPKHPFNSKGSFLTATCHNYTSVYIYQSLTKHIVTTNYKLLLNILETQLREVARFWVGAFAQYDQLIYEKQTCFTTRGSLRPQHLRCRHIYLIVTTEEN